MSEMSEGRKKLGTVSISVPLDGKEHGNVCAECKRKDTEIVQLKEECNLIYSALEDCLEVLMLCRTRHGVSDPIFDPLVKQIGGGHSYGAIMDAASRLWALQAPGGQHTCGPCEATVNKTILKLLKVLGPARNAERDGKVKVR